MCWWRRKTAGQRLISVRKHMFQRKGEIDQVLRARTHPTVWVNANVCVDLIADMARQWHGQELNGLNPCELEKGPPYNNVFLPITATMLKRYAGTSSIIRASGVFVIANEK